MERAITFLNSDCLRLIGVYHEPEANPKNVGILFVHGGSQGRLGHTNQYVYYAREFARHGFPCLRFDPNGLGDSEGHIGAVGRKEFHRSIQAGRYVADIFSAIDEFKQNGVNKVVLFGLCGGAISGLLAGSRHQAVSGMILLSCPVVLEGTDIDDSLRIPTALARRETFVYVKKLFSISALWRLLTLKTDYTRLINLLRASVRVQTPVVEGSHSNTKAAVIKGSSYNKYFFEAYDRCEHTSIMWIYGSNDQYWFEFKRDALNKITVGKCNEIHLVQNGNHMFTLPEWQHEICSVSLNWLARQSY